MNYGFDLNAVGQFMRDHGIALTLPLRTSPTGNGTSNITLVATDSAGRQWVLRRPPLGHLLATAHDVGREFRILRGLDGAGVPAPRALALIENPAVCDAPLMIMSLEPGRVLADRKAAEVLDLASRRRCGLSMVEALAALHSVDVQARRLDTIGSHKPYAPRQLKRWLYQAHSGLEAVRPGILSLEKRLSAAAPLGGDLALVHGDCHLLNVLVDEAGEVQALLDWELSTLGDPLADLGTMLAYWPHSDDGVEPGPFDQSCLPGFARREELTAHYASVSGRSVDTIGYWEALAAWKIAIITKGVLERVKAQGGPSARIVALDHLIDVMLARSEMAATRAGC